MITNIKDRQATKKELCEAGLYGSYIITEINGVEYYTHE